MRMEWDNGKNDVWLQLDKYVELDIDRFFFQLSLLFTHAAARRRLWYHHHCISEIARKQSEKSTADQR